MTLQDIAMYPLLVMVQQNKWIFCVSVWFNSDCNCGYICNRVCGSEVSSKEVHERSPTFTTALFLFAGPTKPAPYQSPLRAGQDQPHSPTTGKLLSHQAIGTVEDHSPNRGIGVSVSCVSPGQNCLGSPSPVRGDGSSLLNGVSGAYISPATHTQRIPDLASSQFLGSPSPGKRGFQNCSPLMEGEHSSGKLTPRNHSSLTGKLRTPSPVQGRMGSYTPVKSSKSWLRLHRISSSKLKGQERRVGKSLSVPDLIVYLDESR